MDDLRAPRILQGLVGTRFSHVEVHAELSSTQTVLVQEGGKDGRVVVADHQTAGRGRAGREWLDVPGAMLMFSALLRGVAPDRAALMGLQAGVAVVRAVGDDAMLKWPNDVRIAGGKVCGIIGELAPGGDYVVVGIGVNVGHSQGDLSEELGATSLRIAHGHPPRRDDLCVAILRELDALGGNDDWLDDYRARCETIGQTVRAEMPDGVIEGEATEVRDDGALVVGGKPVLAGDVVHLR